MPEHSGTSSVSSVDTMVTPKITCRNPLPAFTQQNPAAITADDSPYFPLRQAAYLIRRQLAPDRGASAR